MKNLIAIWLVLASFQWTHSQVGLNLHYHRSDYTGWNEFLPSQGQDPVDLFGQSYQIGVDYGFSLRWYRVSFFPELFFKRSAYELDVSDGINYHFYSFDLMQYGIEFKTFVYPLDLLSKQSMGCPSFYRGGEKFTKGWFLSFHPALFLSRKELNDYGGSIIDVYPLTDEKLIFSFGIGTGIDLGINENFAITPTLRYVFTVGEKWENFASVFDQPSYNDATAVSYWSAGLRVGLWF